MSNELNDHLIHFYYFCVSVIRQLKQMANNQRYIQRGVSASKEDVHNAIKNIDKGLYPKAFCKIIPDYLTNNSEYCNIMHADGAGTKSSLAYIYWRETGDRKSVV